MGGFRLLWDKKIGKALILTGICAMSSICFCTPVYCDDSSMELSGSTLLYNEDSDEYDDVNQDPVGTLSAIYDGVNWVDEEDGMQCFDVFSDIHLSYKFNTGSFSKDTDKWHLDGDGIIVTVAAALETDSEDLQWSTVYKDEWSFEEASKGLSDFYITKDIQLVNGCYYQVWVDYDTAKRTKDNKILDDYDFNSNFPHQ